MKCSLPKSLIFDFYPKTTFTPCIHTATYSSDTPSMNSRVLKSIGLLFLAGILSFSSVSFGNSFSANQRNILPGGRAPFLGGAFTALANDSTGSYYNPAGLAFVSSQEVSISGISYMDNQLVHEGAIDGQDFTEQSSGFATSFIGGLVSMGKLKLGWSILQLDRKDINQNEGFLVNDESRVYVRTHQESNSYEWYGGSVAFRATSNLALGLSGFYYVRNIIVANHNMSYYLNQDDVQIVDQKFLTRNEGGVIALGGLWKGSDWSFGATLKVSKAIRDATTLTYDEVYYAPSSWGSEASEVSEIYQDCFAEQTACVIHGEFDTESLHELNPATLSVGTAWHPTSKFTVSFDTLFHQGVTSPYADSANGDLYDTFNYSLGTELGLGTFVMRAGVFTNNSMYKKPTEGKMNQPMSVDYVGYTGSLGIKSKARDSYIGFVQQVGTGQSQIISNSEKIQNVSARSVFYNVGYTYYF